MATKSITKTINIRSASACKNLVIALERSKAHEPKMVQTRTVEYVKGNDIKKMFGVK